MKIQHCNKQESQQYKNASSNQNIQSRINWKSRWVVKQYEPSGAVSTTQMWWKFQAFMKIKLSYAQQLTQVKDQQQQKQKNTMPLYEYLSKFLSKWT